MSHLSLFKTQVPAPAAFFMSQFLEVSRLNLLWPSYKEVVTKHGYFNEGPLNLTFEAYGYASMYMVGNMPILIAVSIALICVGIIVKIKDEVVRKANSNMKHCFRDIFLLIDHSSWLINFAIRFLLEVFLIVCIACMISVSKGR